VLQSYRRASCHPVCCHRTAHSQVSRCTERTANYGGLKSVDLAQALEWLDTAVRLRDPGLELLKVDPLIDPLRNQPHFQAIERDLKFPD
jgi:hypothetical protein